MKNAVLFANSRFSNRHFLLRILKPIAIGRVRLIWF